MARPKALPNRAELIIGAAEELFARYGYERTSIDDISRHLSIGKGSIYLDFRTKEEILIKILEKHAHTIYNLMEEKVADTSRSGLTVLREMLEEAMMIVHDIVTRDIHTPEALLHTSLQMKCRFSHFHLRKRALILTLLTRAAEQGEIRKENATEEMALAIIMAGSSLHPPYINNYSGEGPGIDKETLRERAKVLYDLIISGLRK